ncbi:MAG: RT0821/Lpp0805 family surface protein [Pseudomonadota bacterium]
MKTVIKSVVALSASMMILAACDGQQNAYNAQRGGITGGGGFSKSDVGTGVGAIAGGVAGAQFGKGNGRLVTTALGALLGAGLGNAVGSSLDRADMQYYDRASQKALETAQAGQSLPWSNPQSGNSGTITPSAPFKNDNGQYCREYTQKINVGGQSQSGYGTACRQPDGSWQIVSQ